MAVIALAVAGAGHGCARSEAAPPLFERLSSEVTGVTFVNELPEDTTFNILNYLYYYNGGGVAAGDIDGDGLPDLYFTSNLGPNRLYRNLGNYRFEDITDRAGVAGSEGWTSGVTMADVNGDGHLDLYVSAVDHLALRGRNTLYVNDGDGTFTDRTDEYGLGHQGYSTQAAFFDYDLDGDLDMYLLNHSVHTERSVSARPQREVRHPRAGDRLFRNDGGRFTDVSAAAGIYGGVEGYGLGVVVSDVDLDGCPDLYIANDFQENDFLYRNDCDGTFTESIASAMGHTSRFSMGVDAADVNDDGRPDLFVADMLPEREEILKTSANAESFTLHDLRLRAGYHPQYARNTLQLNRGEGRFSDVAFLAGVQATDWSWAPLLADLDNDGRKDLFITNGIYRRPNDMDYISYVGNEAVQASLEKGITAENLTILERMPRIAIPNYAFRNDGGLRFTSIAGLWGLGEPGFSNGAVYVDLNNSGALDLVVNNLQAPAAIYRNRGREATGHHHLTVRLQGDGANTFGIGAKVIAVHGGRRQLLEQMPTRGFQSSVDPRLHFGLGRSAEVDSLIVIWPDRRFQVLTDVTPNRVLTLSQRDASGRWDYSPRRHTPLFTDVTAKAGIDFAHRENTFYDDNREPLIPHRVSTEGPALAVGDVNGDGLDDVFLGGAKWQAGRLYVQRENGRFRPTADAAFRADSLAEDVDAAFFDADGDGDQDLYVVSAGNEFWGEHEALRDRLYLNDGAGRFTIAPDRLPPLFDNGSTVAPADFDGDGDIDLFVGSRVVAREYGATPTSRLLENDGTGRFADVTRRRAPALVHAGMVSSAAWIDHDRDGQLDLVVAGEWMPVRLFRQRAGGFVEHTAEAGLSAASGWWNTVVAADLRRTGRDDLVLGNLGLNSYLRASPDEPARLYVGDFFQNGAVEQILTFYKDGVSYPLPGRDELLRQMPQLRSRYPSYADFGASRIDEILPPAELARAEVKEATHFATAVAVRNADGGFVLQSLPIEAQFAPVYAIVADDLDGDGHVDLLTAGNFHGVAPLRGRYDASYGLVLLGDGRGGFAPLDLETSGVVIEGEVRDVEIVRGPGETRLIVVARNDDTPVVLRATRAGDARVLAASAMAPGYRRGESSNR